MVGSENLVVKEVEQQEHNKEIRGCKLSAKSREGPSEIEVVQDLGQVSFVLYCLFRGCFVFVLVCDMERHIYVCR